MGGATIEVTGLRKRFGPVQALDGMSFTVAPGRVTGFIGPNGAGKPVTGLWLSFPWGAGALPRWVCRTTRRILVCHDPLQ